MASYRVLRPSGWICRFMWKGVDGIGRTQAMRKEKATTVMPINSRVSRRRSKRHAARPAPALPPSPTADLAFVLY